MNAAPLSGNAGESPAGTGGPRSAKWTAAFAAAFLVYALVYPLVPIALKQSGIGQRLPDWLEGVFAISAAPLIFAHDHVPAYRKYVAALAAVTGNDR